MTHFAHRKPTWGDLDGNRLAFDIDDGQDRPFLDVFELRDHDAVIHPRRAISPVTVDNCLTAAIFGPKW
jgi:hypothetical protein